MKARKPEPRIQPYGRISLAPDVFTAIVPNKLLKVQACAARLDGRWDVIISGSMQDVIDTARKRGERSSDVLKRLLVKP